MAYLDTFSQPLSEFHAAHLLRRTTFGPTKSEIAVFTGLTAYEAVSKLISNNSYTASPPAPVDLDKTSPTFGKPYMGLPFKGDRSGQLNVYLRFWWAGLMARQDHPPSLLEKMTAFWQNHFVESQNVVSDHRYMYQYLQLLRNNCLGNFRELTISITKDPGMLIFQNGNENSKDLPNENYARELMELFTVGQKDFDKNSNYTEDDVKAAARVLTGWQCRNYYAEDSTTFGAEFVANRHDTRDKVFSEKYGNKIIAGRSGSTAGEAEVRDLVNMLLAHQQTPRFICRKLYRWFVNTNLTREIEEQVIIPLAIFFSSPGNDYKIQPVVEKLLTSEIFFDQKNIGAIIKAPAEHLIGMRRYFNQPVPDMVTDTEAFFNYVNYFIWGMESMQQSILVQPSVLGYAPYYQTGYSRNWINASTIAVRRAFVDSFVFPNLEIKPGYVLGIDFIKWVTDLQTNFSDVNGSPAISCDKVLDEFSKNLFALPLSNMHKDFLIDSVFLAGLPRLEWTIEWNAYRRAPGNTNYRNAVRDRCALLMRYMLNMAEYQIF
jgi:uncharacterized protein (DUF1800 family)